MDNLDQIAFVRVQLEILNDLEPDGEWKRSRLLQKWQTNHYSLTRREVSELTNYLDRQRRLAEIALCDRNYKQLDILNQEEP